MRPTLRFLWLLFALLCGPGMSPAFADTVTVAVAANFTAPMREIARAFHDDTGHTVRLAFGSSGNFYAQIINGAPYQVFLSADETKPIRLEQAGLAVTGSRYTYALGSLVLWSSRQGVVDCQGEVLRSGQFAKLALANPKLAPYGQAAVEVLNNLKLYDKLQDKFVMGENIAQTYQFVLSGNAELGFVARSQVMQDGKLKKGSAWLIPQHLYSPIRQDVVLLETGHDNPAAQALMHYLRGNKAQAIIHAYGYQI